MIVINFTDFFRERILTIVQAGETPIFAMAYYVLSGGIVFLISLLIAVLFEKIYGFIKYIVEEIVLLPYKCKNKMK